MGHSLQRRRPPPPPPLLPKIVVNLEYFESPLFNAVGPFSLSQQGGSNMAAK